MKKKCSKLTIKVRHFCFKAVFPGDDSNKTKLVCIFYMIKSDIRNKVDKQSVLTCLLCWYFLPSIFQPDLPATEISSTVPEEFRNHKNDGIIIVSSLNTYKYNKVVCVILKYIKCMSNNFPYLCFQQIVFNNCLFPHQLCIFK